MALLNRMDWYDLARTTNWTPTYVSDGELFPAGLAGDYGLPQDAWERYDEPYKQTYPEYVKVQREKDAGAYSVKAALERSRIFENADPGWKSVMKAHYGAIARGEYAAASAEARMMRFSRAPGMRNMATLGCLDLTLTPPSNTSRRKARSTRRPARHRKRPCIYAGVGLSRAGGWPAAA